MSKINRIVFIGSATVFLSFFGAAVTFPFLQTQRDNLGCDALCYGAIQSGRSGLSMFGTVLVGRLSDRLGRGPVLWIGTISSLMSFLSNLHGTTIEAMWFAMIPSALLNQNFSIMKALFADYANEYSLSESESASAIGRLGMVVGISYMLGPLLGTTLFANYYQANIAAILCTILSGCCLLFLPLSDINNSALNSTRMDNLNQQSLFATVKENLIQFFDLPVLQSPGAQLLILIRCLMGLAFNMFITVWTVSLKSRFGFGPSEHAYLMGWTGLWYALSQGIFAKYCIAFIGEDPTILLLLCTIVLSISRVVAMWTDSLSIVYILIAMVTVALGIMNTATASACLHLAGKDQLGGLYGVIEAIENLAGLIGPAIGGLLYHLQPSLLLTAVVVVYACVFIAIWRYYHKLITSLKKKAE